MSTESLIKPFGAFAEYTVLPLLDRCRELIELSDKHGLKLKTMLKIGIILFIVDKVFSLVTTIAVTLLICSTALLISLLTVQ